MYDGEPGGTGDVYAPSTGLPGMTAMCLKGAAPATGATTTKEPTAREAASRAPRGEGCTGRDANRATSEEAGGAEAVGSGLPERFFHFDERGDGTGVE